MSKSAILCVDDEVGVLESLEIELQQAFNGKYLCEFAESAVEALEIIEELCEAEVKILVIVSDWLMPGMRGDEFLVQVHQQFGDITKILLTGQADLEAIERAKREANLYCCIHKPWRQEELLETITTALKLG